MKGTYTKNKDKERGGDRKIELKRPVSRARRRAVTMRMEEEERECRMHALHRVYQPATGQGNLKARWCSSAGACVPV